MIDESFATMTLSQALTLDLSAQRVVITGGGSGIGRAIAEMAVASGASVVILDADVDAIGRLPATGQLCAIYCDVADADAANEAVNNAATMMGGVTGLVNGVGIAGPTMSPDGISVEAWRRTLAVNLDGMFYCTRAAIPWLKRNGGSIVNLSSAAIARGGFPMRLAYATSKKAVIGFTETLAMDLGRHAIRVNTVLPGTVEGDRVRTVIAAAAEASGVSAEDLWGDTIAANSLHVAVEAVDVAALVIFLLSDLGRLITSQSIAVCAGFEGHRSQDQDPMASGR